MLEPCNFLWAHKCPLSASASIEYIIHFEQIFLYVVFATPFFTTLKICACFALGFCHRTTSSEIFQNAFSWALCSNREDPCREFGRMPPSRGGPSRFQTPLPTFFPNDFY
jgi:hypothetical protein